MAQTKHTGRTCPSLTRSGIVAAFLATTVAIAVEQSARGDGLVRCWGYNGGGQCNVPTDLSCSTATGGAWYSLVVQSNGQIRGSGYSGYQGQARAPDELGHWSRVDAGLYHSIALQIDGTVRVWGACNYGACDIPADLGPCVSIAAGGNGNMALQSNGIVRCWGTLPSPPADLGLCASIDAGSYHCIAIRIDGSVQCWGGNESGQCNTPADLGPCVRVSAGGYFGHSIAIRTDGAVRCWGYNEYGQCNPPADLGPCVSVAAGYYHSAAVQSDGTVRCWGAGTTVTGNQNEFPPPPEAGQSMVPADLGPCENVAVGYFHTMAIQGRPLDSDGDGRPDSIDNCSAIANPTQADCNTNGVGDVCEIAAGTPDFNADTVPDTCQCIADLFVDRQVNGADLGALLAFWGPVNPALPSADINRDGNVNGADLGYLLNAWGPCTN